MTSENAWPSTEQYREAIAFPADFLRQPVLRESTPDLGKGGRRPILNTGAFGVVFEMRHVESKKHWALKCFTVASENRSTRYQAISDYLACASLSSSIPFEYLPAEILVGGHRYPVLKMEWCDGVALNRYVEQSLDSPQRLQRLFDLWLGLVKELRSAGIAHGDLQHGNVLVTTSAEDQLELKLVDYDGMCVPSLSALPPEEAGHEAYQHPRRLEEASTRIEVDQFPSLVIACAIRVLIVEGAALWNAFNNDNNLLFRQQDFTAPQDSELFKRLWKSPDLLTKRLVAYIILACDSPLGDEPFLPDVLGNGNSFDIRPIESKRIEAILARRSTRISIDPKTQPRRQADRPSQSMPASAATRTPPRTASPGTPLANWTTPTTHFVTAAAIIFAIAILIRLMRSPTEIADTVSPIQMTLVPAGEFMTGAARNNFAQPANSSPQKRIRIQQPFYMAVHEVTQEQFESVMNFDQSDFGTRLLRGLPEWRDLDCQQFPVENVEFLEALEFCNRLSQQSGRTPCYKRTVDGMGVTFLDNDGFRLPSQSQWEYACRTGSNSAFAFGDSLDATKANIRIKDTPFGGGQLGRPTTVGAYPANGFGIYDMHGNVAEWCWGNLDSESEEGLVDVSRRDAFFLTRGGSWNNKARDARSDAINAAKPYRTSEYYDEGEIGFRIVLPSQDAGKSDITIPCDPIDQENATNINDVYRVAPLPIDMKIIPSGRFVMGSPPSEGQYTQFERPQHVVQISPFRMSAHEITQHQYKTVLGSNPSACTWGNRRMAPVIDTSNFPVEMVTWYDAIVFCNELSTAERLPQYYDVSGVVSKRLYSDDPEKIVSAEVSVRGGNGYRLPSEAEWEYACRAGTTTAFNCGNNLGLNDANMHPRNVLDKPDPLGVRAEQNLMGCGRPTTVGSYLPNAFGLFDTHGNVSEWCGDWYDHRYYQQLAHKVSNNPSGPISVAYDDHIGRCRVVRGGSYSDSATDGRAANRSFGSPATSLLTWGFRIVRSIE